MTRRGNATADAALRYQHATVDRDRVVADALAELVKPARSFRFPPVVPRKWHERVLAAAAAEADIRKTQCW